MRVYYPAVRLITMLFVTLFIAYGVAGNIKDGANPLDAEQERAAERLTRFSDALHAGITMDQQYLIALRSISVGIDILCPGKSQKHAMNTQLQTDTVLRLQQSGLMVFRDVMLSRELIEGKQVELTAGAEAARAAGHPITYADIPQSTLSITGRVWPDRNGGVGDYTLSVILTDGAVLDRLPDRSLTVITWHREKRGKGSEKGFTPIRDALKDIIAEFCNDYLKVNSKK